MAARKIVSAAVALLLVLLSASVSLAATTTTCIYSLGPYGDASIKVKAYNPDGILVLTVPLEKGALTSTLLVYNENGTPLDFTVKNGEAVIDAANSTTVWVEYSAVVGNVTDNVVNATIHPIGPATVYLPRGAALVGFNGTAVVDYVSDRIVLRYNSPGTYNIVYLVPPQTTTTTTTTTSTTTTTTTTAPRTTTSTTTTKTTTGTTTTTKSITTTTTTTTTKATTTRTTPPSTTTITHTTTTPKQAISTKTSKTTTSTTSTTTSQTTTTKKPAPPMTTTQSQAKTTSTAQTPATTPATPSTTPLTTTTPVKKSNKTGAIIAGVIAAAVIAALALLLGRRRTGSAGSSTLVDGSSPGGGTGSATEVTLVSSGLDDRDKAILNLLSKEGPLGVSEVARRLGISKSTAWRKLQKLVDMGLVERIVVDGTPLYRVKKS